LNSFVAISIPYGAIKSIEEFIFREVFFTFQFLMVRLKDVSAEFLETLGKQFQFLMVRLKGVGEC